MGGRIGMREKKAKTRNPYLALLLITGAVYFFLRWISPLVTPMLIAGMFLTLCYPAFDDIQRKTRIKKQYMASAILLLLCAVLILLVWFGGSFLLQKIPVWVEGIDGMQQSFAVIVGDCCTNVGTLIGMDISELTHTIVGQVDLFVENLQMQILPGVVGGSWSYIRQLLSVIAVLAVTMIATVLLAKDYDAILAFMGAGRESRVVLEVALRVIRYLATFLKAQVIILLAIGTTCVTILSLAGVSKSVLFGVLAGILDAFPFIGTGIVLVPLAIWQLAQGYYWKALFCIVAYGISALIREFLEPKLIGKREGVYPIAILIAVYAGIRLFGLWGIIKGPVGLVMIRQAFRAYKRYVDDAEQMNYDKEENIPKKETEQ